MFGNFGMGEMIVMLVIVLVLFGAKRVPEISASFGQGIREFKRSLNEVEGSVTGHLTNPPQQGWRPPAPAATPERLDEPAREPKRLM
jgi:sec-independent protein translocase protein TatA